MLHRKHKARIAVLVEKDNTVFCYQSDPDWPVINTISVEPHNKFTPDHFDTVADRTVPAGRGGGISRASSPYSSDSFGSGGEMATLSKTPEADPVHSTAGTVHIQDTLNMNGVCSSEALDMQPYSPGFLPLLDMELQPNIVHETSGDQQQISEGTTSLLSLWDPSSTSSSSCSDASLSLDSSSVPMPRPSKRSRHDTSDTCRNNNINCQSGQKRTSTRKSARSHYQAKQYF